MQLISINLGVAGTLSDKKSTWQSGIFKHPVAHPVEITTDGLVGDTIVNTTNHGGVDQAVYVYGRPDYDWYEAEVGYALPNGTFGENLTIAGLRSNTYTIGDRLHIGPVVLEVTAPRTPCESLNARMGDNQFVKRFFAADKPGFYCRVITPGSVTVGMEVTTVPYAQPGIAIVDAHRIMRPGVTHDTPTIERFLAQPIHGRLRTWLTGELARRRAAGEA